MKWICDFNCDWNLVTTLAQKPKGRHRFRVHESTSNRSKDARKNVKSRETCSFLATNNFSWFSWVRFPGLAGKQPTSDRKDPKNWVWRKILVFRANYDRSSRGSRWPEMIALARLHAKVVARRQLNDMEFGEKTSHRIERSPAYIAHPN